MIPPLQVRTRRLREVSGSAPHCCHRRKAACGWPPELWPPVHRGVGPTSAASAWPGTQTGGILDFPCTFWIRIWILTRPPGYFYAHSMVTVTGSIKTYRKCIKMSTVGIPQLILICLFTLMCNFQIASMSTDLIFNKKNIGVLHFHWLIQQNIDHVLSCKNIN